MLAVRWYLRYGLSYRDVEELLAERGGHYELGVETGHQHLRVAAAFDELIETI